MVSSAKDVEKDPFLLRRDNAAELFLIRHGDALPGAEEIIPGGVYDNLPLSQKGRKQAQALADRLQGMKFDAVYSSPLRRCQETAQPLMERLGKEPIIVEGIKEVRVGDVISLPVVKDGDNLEALSQALHARQLEIARITGASGSWDSIKNSESSKGFRTRVVKALDEIVHKHIGQRALVFTHGGVINAYSAEVLGLEREFFFPCANTSISVFRATAHTRVVYVLNDIAHLQ